MISWLPTCCLWCKSTKNLISSLQICNNCHNKLFLQNFLQHSHSSIKCTSFRVPFSFSDPLREMIHAWKYHAKSELTRPLSQAALASWNLQSLDLDLIIPVPPHRDRLKERRIHQTLLLAKAVSRLKNIPIFYGLIRTKITPSQTTFNRGERQKNLRNAFQIKSPEKITNRRILLIDDIITTGATIREAIKAVKQGNPLEIHVRALARQDFTLTTPLDNCYIAHL